MSGALTAELHGAAAVAAVVARRRCRRAWKPPPGNSPPPPFVVVVWVAVGPDDDALAGLEAALDLGLGRGHQPDGHVAGLGGAVGADDQDRVAEGRPVERNGRDRQDVRRPGRSSPTALALMPGRAVAGGAGQLDRHAVGHDAARPTLAADGAMATTLPGDRRVDRIDGHVGRLADLERRQVALGEVGGRLERAAGQGDRRPAR